LALALARGEILLFSATFWGFMASYLADGFRPSCQHRKEREASELDAEARISRDGFSYISR
jgi:hypothetical protein